MHRVSRGLEFAGYLRSQWYAIVASCGVALLLTGVVSFLLPKRYTATASIVIEPPAGNDPRAATAVNSVYLESLITYERYASSDTLFLRALDGLHLRERYGGASIESLKSRILSVTKPLNTKIVEISATLEDPREAQAFAQYIAEQTVAMNKSLGEQSLGDATRESQRVYDDARTRFEVAERARDAFTKAQSVSTLAGEVRNAVALKASVEQDLVRTKAELADYTAQRQVLPSAGDGEAQGQWTASEIAATRARLESLEAQDRALAQETSEKGALLEKLGQRQEALDNEFKQTRADAEATRAKLVDLQASAPFRDERLEILDPGIVPQRTSSPNIPLNLAVAALLSLMGCVAYLLLRFSYARLRAVPSDEMYSMR